MNLIRDPQDSDVQRLFFGDALLLFTEPRLTRLRELSALAIHAVERWKKMKSRDALATVKDLKAHPLSVWAKDRDSAAEIQSIMRQTEDEVRQYVRRWFDGVELGAELNSWRYTMTRDEPLHFDEYASRVNCVVVRVFVNLDTEPRIWNLGPVATPEDSGTYDPIYKARLSKGPSSRLEFAPGQMWVVDSRRVAHAIIYGRRAAMFSYEVKGRAA
jgi:hypothetical protein